MRGHRDFLRSVKEASVSGLREGLGVGRGAVGVEEQLGGLAENWGSGGKATFLYSQWAHRDQLVADARQRRVRSETEFLSASRKRSRVGKLRMRYVAGSVACHAYRARVA